MASQLLIKCCLNTICVANALNAQTYAIGLVRIGNGAGKMQIRHWNIVGLDRTEYHGFSCLGSSIKSVHPHSNHPPIRTT